MRWRRIAGWFAVVVAVPLVVIGWRVAVIAHRPSRVQLRQTITPAEILAEDARLKELGLIVHDGSFLKEHPFEPPWTGHSLLVPEAWSESLIKRLFGPRQVRADQLLVDLDVLEPVMERAYGGWDSAKARGWDWNHWFADWRKQLAAKGHEKLSFDEAFAPIDAMIAFQRDNHTQIPLVRTSTSNGSQTAILSKAPGGRCTEIRANDKVFPIAPDDAGQQVRSAKLWRTSATNFVDGNYISMPSSFGTPQALHCGDVWIPLQPIGKGRPVLSFPILKTLWNENFNHDQARIERLGDGVVYARLPTFISRNYDGISRTNWPQPQSGDRVLIVDMRDNGGNSEEYGVDALKDWVDESRMVAFDKIGAEITSSCLSAALNWQVTESKQYTQGLLDRISQPYPPGCPRTVDTKPSQWTYLQHHFSPTPGKLRIIALVNSHCGSDCELLTSRLASLPETIVVGSNTFGVCQMIQPRSSVLPHTGLPYRIAVGRSDYYGDNRSVESYGLDVDLVLPQVNELNLSQLHELAEVVARTQPDAKP